MLSLRSLRRTPTFTDEQRTELLDELLAERFPLPAPTLTEAHQQYRQAVLERDRLQAISRAAAAEVARLDAGQAAASRREPDATRQLAYDYELLRAPHRMRHAEAETLLADLASTVDWPVLEAGEKSYVAAVAELRGAHDQLRLEVRREAVQTAEERHRAARAAVDESVGYNELSQALRRVAELETAVVLARRALTATEATVPGKRGRR